MIELKELIVPKSHRSYWSLGMQPWTKISRMPAPAIKEMQNSLLQQMLTGELAVRHPYYRELFKEKSINPADIKRIEDLKKIPFTEKTDVAPNPDDRFVPKKFVLEKPKEKKQAKKGFLSRLFGNKSDDDLSDYIFQTLFITSGRTGSKPVPIEYTQYDIANLKEAGSRFFDIMDLTRDDTLINAFNYLPNPYYWQMYHSTIDIGATALQSGGGKVLGLEKILKATENMKAKVLATSPGYALFALQTLGRFGIEIENLERIVIGIDYSPEVLVKRLQKILSSLGVKEPKVQRSYFLSEAKSGWAECTLGCGYHTNPDHVLVEIVDPETGEVLEEGKQGEVVITNLDARGTVFLRFKTGDIATGGFTTEPCPNCKRTVPRIMGDIERKSLFYKLKGENGSVLLNGNRLKHTMLSREDILCWYAEIHSGQSGDELKIVFKEGHSADKDDVRKSLETELVEKHGVPVKIESSSFNPIFQKTGMEKFITEQTIFDNRKD